MYQGYNKDFGPLTLAQLHRYCTELFKIMKDPKNAGVRIFHHCSPRYNKQANACFLMSAFMVVCYEYTAEKAFEPFQDTIAEKLTPFRDAGEDSCQF